jgi:hypothetical protein
MRFTVDVMQYSYAASRIPQAWRRIFSALANVAGGMNAGVGDFESKRKGGVNPEPIPAGYSPVMKISGSEEAQFFPFHAVRPSRT